MMMDMDMPAHPLWLDQPLMLHSSRVSECDMTPEQCFYKTRHWRNWYQADLVYGLNTVYFFVATIGVCILAYWAHKLAPRRVRESTIWQRMVGTARYLTYRRFNVAGKRTPSVGVCLLITIGAAFFFGMTLGPKPYYWPNSRDGKVSYGNSPPLATRAGWMSLACLPFMIILPAKANMIASLTGVSHERLIVFHNFVGWAMFVLALIHTFPFIVFHEFMGDMAEQLPTSIVWWTGIVALILQAFLQFFSISYIRNRFYEVFKATHFAAALLFVFFFFLHCDATLTSWDYFIATGVLYTLSWLYSQVRTYFEFGFLRATLEMVSDRALKITIPINNSNSTWTPTQHVFLRFTSLGTHAFSAHPFTICSAPPSPNSDSRREMVFYVHPQGGLTGRLASLARSSASGTTTVPVLLDGPYGGIKNSNRPLTDFDRSVIVACGSGASLSLPLIMDALLRLSFRRRREQEQQGSTGLENQHKMSVYIATRDVDLVRWYEDALLAFMEENKSKFTCDDPDDSVMKAINIYIYQTSGGTSSSSSISPPSSSTSSSRAPTVEKGVGGNNVSSTVTPANDVSPAPSKEVEATAGAAASVVATPTRLASMIHVIQNQGRPELCDLVRQSTLEEDGVSVGIVCCGPQGVTNCVQGEAAEAQKRIMKGSPQKGKGAREVYLHSESFTW